MEWPDSESQYGLFMMIVKVKTGKYHFCLEFLAKFSLTTIQWTSKLFIEKFDILLINFGEKDSQE